MSRNKLKPPYIQLQLFLQCRPRFIKKKLVRPCIMYGSLTKSSRHFRINYIFNCSSALFSLLFPHLYYSRLYRKPTFGTGSKKNKKSRLFNIPAYRIAVISISLYRVTLYNIPSAQQCKQRFTTISNAGMLEFVTFQELAELFSLKNNPNPKSMF